MIQHRLKDTTLCIDSCTTVMSDWRACRVSRGTSIREAMQRIEACRRRVALVTASDGRLQGVVTDGDIRRGILDGMSLERPVTEVMNGDPVVAREGSDAEHVAQLMRDNPIHNVPIVDAKGRVVRLETVDDIVVPEERSAPVVVMAGGLGTRLRPITDGQPKPLVEVEDGPILETLIKRLSAQGFRHVYLSVNYEAEMIEEYFGDGSEWGLQVEYLREEKRLGTAGPLGLLPERPSEPILVVNGDLLTTLNFGQLMDFHDEKSPIATMGVRRYRTEIPYGVAEVDGHRITGLEEKPTEEYFVNAGIYVLEPEALGRIPDNTFFDMPELFQLLLEEKRPVTAYPIEEYWRDIARQEDLQRAKDEFSQVFDG